MRLVILVLISLFVNCTVYYKAQFDIARPVCEKRIENKIVNHNISNGNFDYVDDILCLKVKCVEYGFQISITNNTDEAIKIQWDDAVYVDCENKSHSVARGNDNEITKDLLHSPSIVARKSQISELIVPADIENYDYDSDDDYHWYLFPFVKNCFNTNKDVAVDCAKEKLKRSFSLSIPMTIDSSKMEYSLSYTIKNAVVVKYLESTEKEKIPVTP